MVANLDSKTQSEVNLVCDSGVESYISAKHRENIKANFEKGMLGSFVGCSLLFVASQFNKDIKLSYLIFPASLGIISSSLSSIVNYNSKDLQYREDFEEVCKNSQKDNK